LDKSRRVGPKGPRGTLKREFKSNAFAAEVLGKRTLKVDMWFGNRLEKACLRTICTHIENMMAGVTKGFTFKMRFAYAHFPINVTLAKDGPTHIVEVRNFLGERRLRRVRMHEGVEVKRTDGVKDEIVLVGSDLEKVSGSAALIHESVLVRNKDIRKFLDGIYVRCVAARARARGVGRARGGGAWAGRLTSTRVHCLALTTHPPPPRALVPCLPLALQRKGGHRQDGLTHVIWSRD
jgi:large subunit ribosomal protein L9e